MNEKPFGQDVQRVFIYLKKGKELSAILQTVKGYEWISNCFNRHCSTFGRLSAVWKMACKEMGN